MMSAAVVLGIVFIAVVLGHLVGTENITAESHPMYDVFNMEPEGSFSNQNSFNDQFWRNKQFGGPFFDSVNSSECGREAVLENSIKLNLKEDF